MQQYLFIGLIALFVGFKEEVGAVDAMEEEMGAAAAADADHERVSSHQQQFT